MQPRKSHGNNSTGPFELKTQRLGPLPIVNHFLQALGIEEIFQKHVPAADPRATLSHAKALGVLLRSVIVEREPIYRQQETVAAFHPGAYGLSRDQHHLVGDDRIGRALDELFESDRASMLSRIMLAAATGFHLHMDEVHNDTTSIRFCGQYRTSARGRAKGQHQLPWITYGYSKDHRPDLKQLMLCLTTTSDGGVPVQFRCLDGNTNDADTHIQTWDTLRALAGRPDFLYVADSKLCTRDNMDHIDRNGGKFVTVMPRSRLEDAEFRKWIQTNEPQWEKVWDRPNPRRRGGPRDRWYVFVAALPSREAWPVTWVYSTLLAMRQEHTRREHIAAATDKLADLRTVLGRRKSRIRKANEVDARVEKILQHHRVSRYLSVRRVVRLEHTFRQTQRGRPGPETSYKRKTRRQWDLQWELNNEAIEYDRKTDGMYPLLTNDRSLRPSAVLEAHKGQPSIEKRFEQTKTVHEIAPVFLKKPQRIEALFTLYFIGLLVQSLIERQLRRSMVEKGIDQLPLYPEERRCTHPTADQILRLFSHVQCHTLLEDGRTVQYFMTNLTDLQKKVLSLLGVDPEIFQQII